MTTPTYSVVMPAYNAAATIAAALASALRQPRDDLEVIVVDDGSTDGTSAEIARFAGDPRLRLIAQDNRGPGAARNAAFAIARGEFVSMLDSDDVWLPDYLKVVSAAFARRPDADIAYTNMWILDDPPGRLRRLPAMPPPPAGPPLWLDGPSLLERLARVNFLPNSTVTVRREAVEAAGGCNGTLLAAVDYDLWIRLAARGTAAIRVPTCHVVYRVRPGSIQDDRVRSWRYVREIARRLVEEYDVPDAVRATAAARLREADRMLAALTGRDRRGAAVLRLRARAGAVKEALLASRTWYRDPPPELADLVAPAALSGHVRRRV